MHPRVLIVGTVPYNTKSTSRAFDAYFHYWEKENSISNYEYFVWGRICPGYSSVENHYMVYRIFLSWSSQKCMDRFLQ